MRNLQEGASSHSYGIHVARLAGLQSLVVTRAKEILKNLEGEELDERGQPKLARGSQKDDPGQMVLFGAHDCKLRDELRRVDVSALTPIEALNLLHLLSEKAKKESE